MYIFSLQKMYLLHQLQVCSLHSLSELEVDWKEDGKGVYSGFGPRTDL